MYGVRALAFLRLTKERSFDPFDEELANAVLPFVDMGA